ncbi:MAG: Gfo/Idh/MocA family oxidoreductase [Thermomicrobiales bacterium]|nr:Gfo/Idh/MocA family oxidoreductase [Thermomicrobiales bacterium]
MRLALLSFWHVHAADYARDAAEHPVTEIVAVWDAQPERGRLEAETRHLTFVDDLDAMLLDPSIEGVIVTTETTAHIDLVPKIAAAGKHIFIEKVIAPTLRESLAIVDAVRAADVTMMVALTRAIVPATVRTLELIGQGTIGTPTSSRVRIAHDGALPTPDRPDGWLPVRFFDVDESGGGAMIDLGAHPLYLTRLFLGMPDRLTAIYGDVTGRDADDNAVALFGYANGAIGVAETGFVSGARNSGFEINGTEASILHELGADHLLLKKRGDETERIELPAAGPGSFARWVDAIQTGASTDDNLRLALELSALHEAAAHSAEWGRAVALEELDGWERLAATQLPNA